MVIAKQIAATSVGSNRTVIRTSYENKGTWQTAQQIVKNCGFLGLYSGFQLQMGKMPTSLALELLSNLRKSARDIRYGSILRVVRKRKAAICQVSRRQHSDLSIGSRRCWRDLRDRWTRVCKF